MTCLLINHLLDAGSALGNWDKPVVLVVVRLIAGLPEIVLLHKKRSLLITCFSSLCFKIKMNRSLGYAELFLPKEKIRIFYLNNFKAKMVLGIYFFWV